MCNLQVDLNLDFVKLAPVNPRVKTVPDPHKISPLTEMFYNSLLIYRDVTGFFTH